jgi:ABC-2 type transport system permease protein
MTLGLILAEVFKLHRSLVLLLLVGIPLIVGVLLVAILVTGNGPDDWQRLAMTGSAIWAYFLFPMTATAFTALQAQIEYGPGSWAHALSSSHGRSPVFLSKAVVALAAMALISLLIGVAVLAGGQLGGWLSPEHALTGPYPVSLLASLLSRMWLAGFLLIGIQFAIAMAFRSFAAPVVAGIGGTFVATVATSAKAGIYFPWLLPTNILASDPVRAQQALITGFLAGLVVLVLSATWLGRRDWL